MKPHDLPKIFVFWAIALGHLQLVGNTQELEKDNLTLQRKSSYETNGMFRLDSNIAPRVWGFCFSPDSKHLAYVARGPKISQTIVVMNVETQSIANLKDVNGSTLYFGDNETLVVFYDDKVSKWNFVQDSIDEKSFPKLTRIWERENKSVFACGAIDERDSIGKYIYVSTRDGLERFNWREMSFEHVFSWKTLQLFFQEQAKYKGALDEYSKFRFYWSLPSLVFADESTMIFRFGQTGCSHLVMHKQQSDWDIKKIFPVNIVGPIDPSKPLWVDNGSPKLSSLGLTELLSSDWQLDNYKHSYYGDLKGITSSSPLLSLSPIRISSQFGYVIDNGSPKINRLLENENRIVLRITALKNGKEVAKIKNMKHPVVGDVGALSDFCLSPNGRFVIARFNESPNNQRAIVWDLATLKQSRK